MYLRAAPRTTRAPQMVELEPRRSRCATGSSRGSCRAHAGPQWMRFLIEQAFAFSEDELKLIGDTWHWPHKIKDFIEESKGEILRDASPTRGDARPTSDARRVLLPRAAPGRAPRVVELMAKRDAFTDELDEFVTQLEMDKVRMMDKLALEEPVRGEDAREVRARRQALPGVLRVREGRASRTLAISAARGGAETPRPTARCGRPRESVRRTATSGSTGR